MNIMEVKSAQIDLGFSATPIKERGTACLMIFFLQYTTIYIFIQDILYSEIKEFSIKQKRIFNAIINVILPSGQITLR